MAEPQDFPASGDGSVTSLTWAEGGTATQPSDGRKATGALVGDVLASAEWNWLMQAGYQFSRASWARGVRSSDAFFASWMPPTGAGVWSTDAMPALNGFLSDAPTGVNSVAADMFLDPDDVGAVRVQVVVAKASPHLFTANRDTYVFVPIDLITPPLATEADLTYSEVPVGDPAPATPVGTVPVWRVETDGSTIVDQEILLLQFPVLKDIAAESLVIGGDLGIAGELSVDGPADFQSTVMVDLALTCGDDVSIAGELAVTGPTTLNNELAVTGPATFSNTVTCNGTVTVAAPLYNYTHAAAADWRDSVRPSVRTFAVSGTVAGGGETTKTPITTATGSDALFSINDLTPTTNSAFVSFDVSMQIVWSNDANPPSGSAGLQTSLSWTDVASYDAGTWSSVTNGSQDLVGAALGGSAVSLELDSGQIVMQIVHDLGVENRGYRWAATIRGRILQLAT